MINVLRTRRSTAWIGLGIFVATMALYSRTVGPTLGGGHDSAEFQQIAYSLGIAHPTGYPLYMLLGQVFILLFPVGSAAYRMNVLSAVLGAGAAVSVYLAIHELTRRNLAAIAATALFVTNVAVWRQSGVASVSPLHLLLLGGVVYALFHWRSRLETGLVGPPILAAFLFGLGLAHHRSIILLAPAILVYLLLVNPSLFKHPGDLVRSSAVLILPLVIYLYLPLRANSSPWYQNTLQGFLSQVSASEAGNYFRTSLADLGQVIGQLADYLQDSFGYLGLGMIIAGAAWSLPRWNHKSKPESLFLGIAALTFWSFAILFSSEQDRYFVLPFVFFLFWFALGVAGIQSALALAASSPRRFGYATLAAGLALIVILPFGGHYGQADWSAYDREYKQWNEIFSLPLPQGATIVGDWRQLNDMRYMQRVENRRPDLEFVGTMYDQEPQTMAASAAFADGRSLYLSPGIPLPKGEYRYALLGPLLEVRNKAQMDGSHLVEAQTTTVSAAGVALVGMSLSTALETYAPARTVAIAPGRTVRVALDWHVEHPVGSLIIRLQLFDPAARLIAQTDERPVRGLYPPSQWVPGEYISDVHNLLIPPGTAPGEYSLQVQVLGKTVPSEPLAVSKIDVLPAMNLTRDMVFIQHRIDVPLNSKIALAGYGGLDKPFKPGELVGVSLLWAVRQNPAADVNIRMALLDSAGKPVQEWTRPPISYYPTHLWQTGELLKAYYDLPLTVGAGSQDYVFAISLEQEPWHSIGHLQIAP